MKIAIFNVLEFEKEVLNDVIKESEDEILLFEDCLTVDTISKAEGCISVSVVSYSKVDSVLLDKMKEMNINCLSTRTIGFDHIDVRYAKEIGIHVFNAYYQPNNVADFAVMLMLMMIRNAKISICRALVNDFSLDGLQGREMRSLIIGVIGTGKIGSTVIKNLSGFGCKIIAYDVYQNPGLTELAEYVDLETLYRKSDIITLHTPLTVSNWHMINDKTIEIMKDDVILINTARGQLIDTKALIRALENKKVGGAAIDTIEEEDGVMHTHVGTNILSEHKRDLLYIKQFPNVIYTQHYGFYTKEASESMTRCGIESLIDFNNGKTVINEVTK